MSGFVFGWERKGPRNKCMGLERKKEQEHTASPAAGSLSTRTAGLR